MKHDLHDTALMVDIVNEAAQYIMECAECDLVASMRGFRRWLEKDYSPKQQIKKHRADNNYFDQSFEEIWKL